MSLQLFGGFKVRCRGRSICGLLVNMRVTSASRLPPGSKKQMTAKPGLGNGNSAMRVCIHRGTKEIGGTCVEIESGGTRIVLDVGLPLDVTTSAEMQLH